MKCTRAHLSYSRPRPVPKGTGRGRKYENLITVLHALHGCICLLANCDNAKGFARTVFIWILAAHRIVAALEEYPHIARAQKIKATLE